MICAKCKKSAELNQGFFNPAGMVPGSTVKKHDFICNDCTRSIDVTSRDPGEDEA
jgi:hypothetical protein